MAGRGATLELKITGDASDAKRALDDVEGHSSRLDGVFGKVGAGIAAGAAVGVAAIGGLSVAAFNAASDLQQSTGAIDAVFGDWALDIEQAAQGAADAVGLSTSEYENLAAVLGSQLKGAGMNIGDVTSKTQDLITMGADMAATFGGPASDAVSALSSVLKGEFDPIERYGVSLKQSDINARLAAQGQSNLTGEALKQAQAQAALDLVTQQTSATQGMFASESDTAAGAQERLGAKFEDIKAVLGEKLLPIFTDIANWILDKAIPAFEKWTEKGGPLNDAFDKISTFVKDQLIPTVKDMWSWWQEKVVPVLDQVARFITDTLVPAFEKVWDFIKTYIVPILRDTLGPALDGLKEAFKKINDKINENKDKVQDAYDKAKPFLDFVRDKVAPFVGTVLKQAFEDAGDAIGTLVDAMAWILDKAGAVLGWVGRLFGATDGKSLISAGSQGGPNIAQAAAPGLYGAARPLTAAAISSSGGGGTGSASRPAGTGGDTYQITVTGALDPDAVADQIEAMLRRRARMTGRAAAGAF
jgi:hypothetical protein